MAPWLISALRLIAGGFGAGVAFEGGQQLIGPVDPRTGSPELFASFPGVGGLFGEQKKRRRRRRALTHQDKDDISFVAAVVGEPTARKFALILAAHHR